MFDKWVLNYCNFNSYSLDKCQYKEVIDLFAKLVLGTFTFIGPAFTLLISLFAKQLRKSTLQYRDRLTRLINLEETTNKDIRRKMRQNKWDTWFLRPKLQIFHLFGSLMSAIALIAFFYLQHTSLWPFKHIWIKIVTISLSFLFFAYSAFILWKVFAVIIKTKIEDENLILQTQNPLTIKK